MKIGKFTIEKGHWYYKKEQLDHPIRIIWKALLITPIFIATAILGLLLSLANWDTECFCETWNKIF